MSWDCIELKASRMNHLQPGVIEEQVGSNAGVTLGKWVSSSQSLCYSSVKQKCWQSLFRETSRADVLWWYLVSYLNEMAEQEFWNCACQECQSPKS